MKDPVVFVVYRDLRGFRIRIRGPFGPRTPLSTKIGLAHRLASDRRFGRALRAYVDIIPEHLIRG